LHGVKKEAAILHRLSACDNIVNVLGIFERPEGAVVLMEYASGGTLHDHLHGVSMADMSTGTGTGTGASLASGTADGGGGCESLPPLEQAEQLSILIDVARAMVFCYMQDPPVHHRYGSF
jgi:serine/threonine protein kinase